MNSNGQNAHSGRAPRAAIRAVGGCVTAEPEYGDGYHVDEEVPVTEHPALITGRARKSSTFVALAAAGLLAASCGTGEDSPSADGDTSPAADSSETSESTSGGSGSSGSADDAFATADLVNTDGESRGTVQFVEADGGTKVIVEATDLPPGFHGLHIHGVGQCEPDSEKPSEPGKRGAFLSATGHLAGPDGEAVHPEHAGDLPPLFVTEDGSGQISTLTDRLDQDLLLDDDGSAVIIHEKGDNLAHIPERYAPDGPDEDSLSAGDGGSRIACGALSEQG